MSLSLPPLPYASAALEPHISRRTLAEHHGFHHAAYVERTRSLIQRTPLESATLEEIVRASAPQGNALFRCALQAWSHAFYWNGMRPGGGGPPGGAIAALIASSFGTQRAFNRQFVQAAGDQYGNAWAWLVLDDGQLRIITTADAGTPLTEPVVPLLALDLWEHAYYLDYQHRRLDYIAAFLGHLVNWDFVNAALAAAGTRARATTGSAMRRVS
ncbi:MAG: superoxide dismutase [Gammaproteobacteria bacterium]|nr:superoxide dismutase [Gammaproteobacteria bacterium]